MIPQPKKSAFATGLVAFSLLGVCAGDSWGARRAMPFQEHIGSTVVERLRDPVLARARSLAPELRRVLDSIRGTQRTAQSEEMAEKELLAGFYYVASKDAVSSRAASPELPGNDRARALEKELARRLDLLRRELKDAELGTPEFEARLEDASARIFDRWDAEKMRFLGEPRRLDGARRVEERAEELEEREEKWLKPWRSEAEEEASQDAWRPGGQAERRSEADRQADEAVRRLRQDLGRLTVHFPEKLTGFTEEISNIFDYAGFRAFPNSWALLGKIHGARHHLRGKDAARAMEAYLVHFEHLVNVTLPRAVKVIEREENRWWYPMKWSRISGARERLASAYESLSGVMFSAGEVDRLIRSSGLSAEDAAQLEMRFVGLARAHAALGYKI